MCRKWPFGRCLFRLTSCLVCRILASTGGVVTELEQATDGHPQHPTAYPGLLPLEILAVVTPALFRPYTQPPHFIARCIVLRGICLRFTLSPVLCTHSRDGAIPATAWVLTAVTNDVRQVSRYTKQLHAGSIKLTIARSSVHSLQCGEDRATATYSTPTTKTTQQPPWAAPRLSPVAPITSILVSTRRCDGARSILPYLLHLHWNQMLSCVVDGGRGESQGL